MDIDKGASVPEMTRTEYKRLCSLKTRPPLYAARIKLKTYTGERRSKSMVNHQREEERLPLVIVESKEPNLLRRDWLTT